MKRYCAGFLLLACLLPPTPLVAQTAQVTLFGYSLKFHQAVGPGGTTLDLTTVDGAPNGELAPFFGSHTHISFFILDDGFLPIEGTMVLNVPLGADVNRNGFPDFFESSQGVGTTTSGSYQADFTGGTVTATWNRAAGSAQGTCVLSLTDSVFGWLGNYNHAFELLEYRGTLAYTPGPTNVVGTAAWTRTGSSGQTLAGTLEFWKSLADPFNRLELQPGHWTNATGQALVFSEPTDIVRYAQWPTNYSGVVVLDDGDLSTPAADYKNWVLSIDDPNDTDGDGIPNFSDTPGSGGPRRPALSLQRAATNLVLTLSGEVGRMHRLLESTNLSTGPWLTNRSLTLTNDPQIITLPLPPSTPRFWRALAE